MKNLFYLYFISALFFASCDEFITIDEEIISSPEEVTPPADTDENNTPSDFDFTSLQAGDTLNIAFSHDLDGKSIEIPADVVINYNAGEIVNGTFVFTEGKIAGELLNQDLTIEGTPTLNSTIFKFEKSKWDITEGEVSDDIALINKETLNGVIAQVKSYGAEVFQIDDLDAYFWIDKELKDGRPDNMGGILLPSDFTLEMTDDTYLRVQANHYLRYQLLGIRDVSNVNINGGNLRGDRDYHDYTRVANGSGTNSSHEWGHLIAIEGGQNVKITNVHMAYASGDGIDIHGIQFTYHPDYIASKDITISDCVFDSNRRNNLSITDGHDMIIENNTFLNAGIDTDFSKGVSPKLALDVEATRTRDSEGNLVYYQRAYDIMIRSNIERGSVAGSFYVAIGEDVTIENNTSENYMGFGFATGVKVIGNTVTSRDGNSTGIVAGRPTDSGTIFGNEISGNIINGFKTGINVNNTDVKVYDNEIDDCITGIALGDLSNADIYDNIIRTERDANCYGIFAHVGSLDDVEIRGNIINVAYKPIAFTNINIEAGQENYSVTVKDNNLNGGEVSISNSNGIKVE